MRTDFSAKLNGIDILSLSELIYIEDIQEEPKVTVETESRGSYGLFLLSEPEREQLDITFKVKIKERDRLRRQEIITAIKAWAKKGWLEINTRVNQQIYVVCTKPLANKSFKTSESMEMTFTAFEEAYWSEIDPSSVSLSGATGSGSLSVLGSRSCFLEVEAKNTSSGSISSFSVTANGQTLAFTGLSLAANAKLKIYYDEKHIMHAKAGSSNIMSKRTEDSDDDIILDALTTHTVSYTASASCEVKIMARGLYD